jgi:hypothetical protein
MSRIDQVCADVEVDVEENDQDDVETLGESVDVLLCGTQECTHSEEQHQPVLGLEPLDRLEV